MPNLHTQHLVLSRSAAHSRRNRVATDDDSRTVERNAGNLTRIWVKRLQRGEESSLSL
jgi:hypothetical protein